MKKSLLPGILLLLVSVFVMGQTQMPNGNLEDWTDTGLGFENPNHWQTPNEATLITMQFTTTKSTDAASGSYSARLEAIEVAAGFVAPGVITLGNFTVDYINNTAYLTGGIPYNDRPLYLTGTYKNYPAANDSSITMVYFTEYLADKGETDTIGIGVMYGSETVDSWTNFHIPIAWLNDHNPDTMNLFVVSSNMINPTAGSLMYIDKLEFVDDLGIEENANLVNASVFPNPATDYLNFTFDKEVNGELKLFSNEGQLIYSVSVKGVDQKIDLSTFATGTYYYGLFEKDKKLSSGQFVISR
jgi:hypothetical protein